MEVYQYQYDAFLSYAVEDKIELVNELYKKLTDQGLKIWYAGSQLKVGKSIEKTIWDGLQRSRYGIVIITPNYFEKSWTQRELGALWAKERVILPIFHNVTYEYVARYDMALAERWALDTRKGVDVLVAELVETIRPASTTENPAEGENQSGGEKIRIRDALLSLLALVVIAGTFWTHTHYSESRPEDQIITTTIEQRISALQKDIENDFYLRQKLKNVRMTSRDTVLHYYKQFSALKAQYRNTYEFSNGVSTVQFRKHVEPATGIDFDAWSPADDYGFGRPNIYLADRAPGNGLFSVSFIYVNTQPVTYKIENRESHEKEYTVSVSYTNPFRLAETSLTYTEKTDYRKLTHCLIRGFLPEETYHFAMQEDQWALAYID